MKCQQRFVTWGYKWPVATHGVDFQIRTMAVTAHHFNRLLAHAQRNYTFLVNSNQIDDIFGSHGHEYENDHLLECETL